jgi:acyl-CoA thioesterase FadM
LLKADDTGNACELMCALVRHPAESGAVAALAVIVGQSAYTSQAEHQLLKQLGYDETMFGIKMTNDGPHGQVLYFQRFPVAFKDNQSSSGSVAFSKYFDWTGLVREYSVRPYRQGILETMRAEGAGLASQSMKARIWDDIREHDVVEVKVWLERVLESRSSFVTAFEWCVVLPDGTTKKVAYTEQMVTWVRMSGDVNPRMGDLPPIFRKFLDEMAPVRNKHIASVDQADARLLHFQLGDERSIAGNASGEPVLLHEEEFQTTLEESNYVGNIYFAHYAKWLGATRDLWFHKEFPDVFSGTAGQGEFFSILCDIDHLQEAMPFDMVLVRMFLDKLFDTGLDLRFEYFLMDQNRVGRKLAVAKQRVVWVNRNRSIIEAVKLPNELLERLGGLIHTAAPPLRKANGGTETGSACQVQVKEKCSRYSIRLLWPARPIGSHKRFSSALQGLPDGRQKGGVRTLRFVDGRLQRRDEFRIIFSTLGLIQVRKMGNSDEPLSGKYPWRFVSRRHCGGKTMAGEVGK